MLTFRGLVEVAVAEGADYAFCDDVASRGVTHWAA